MTPAAHFADRLLQAVREKNSPLCLGMDPFWEMLPPPLRRGDPPDAFRGFALTILEALAPHLPAVKFQLACFERFGAAGFAALEEAVRQARRWGLIVILDGKRGDIGSTAAEYAYAYLDPEGPFDADAVTLNPYLGWDSLAPFAALFLQGKGGFALVRTSNPSAGDLQDLPVDGLPLYRRVGQIVAGWGKAYLGVAGYSALGAVVGATYPLESGQLRRDMPHTFFLLPGYGAQGAGEADLLPAFDDRGEGVLVNSSRAILYAYQKSPAPPQEYVQTSLEAYLHATQQINRALAERSQKAQ